jgi:7-carboxy-7-deazaguanine synthase
MTPSQNSFLEVCEVFRSLQGETTWSGRPATFIRLAGCNLRCRYCDSGYAWGSGQARTVGSLIAGVDRSGELVVVTGGEPLLQPPTRELLDGLVRAGHTVVLETNGTQDIDGLPPEVVRVVDVKCPGSGESDQNRWANLDLLEPNDEVKLVVSDRQDFDFAVDVVDRYRLEDRCAVLLSPVAEHLAPATLAEWILDRGGGLRLQLQLHRILWPDQDRGV